MTITAWHQRITTLANHLEHHHPEHAPTLGDIRHLADQVRLAHPRAIAMNDLGDGLRSPNLDPGSPSLGSHADPVATIAITAATRDSDPLSRQRRSEAARSLATTCLASALTTTDPDRRRRLLLGARHELATALGHLHRNLPPPGAIRRIHLADQGDPGCTSCRRAGTYQPTRKGSQLCDWCYRWRNAHGHLPALPILEARAAGKRITTRLITEVTARRRTKKPKRHKGRR